MLKYHYVLDLILDSLWIILIAYCKFCAFGIILFYITYFFWFYLRINKPNIHNNVIGISTLQNGL